MSKPDTGPELEIVITVNGELAYTIPQAAARHGVQPSSMRGTITRQKIQPIAELDKRTPLYDPAVIDAAVGARPGKAWRKGRGHQSGA